jgi:hypothetical protein
VVELLWPGFKFQAGYMGGDSAPQLNEGLSEVVMRTYVHPPQCPLAGYGYLWHAPRPSPQ